jgi:hypothetical protein
LFAWVSRRCAKDRFQKPFHRAVVQNVAVSEDGHCKWIAPEYIIKICIRVIVNSLSLACPSLASDKSLRYKLRKFNLGKNLVSKMIVINRKLKKYE